MEQPSVLSDALLHDLIAVGHADIVVGLPTLNNAETVGDVVRAVQVAFVRDFPRERTVLLNSDGGSADGTPELVRGASLNESDTLLTSHPLRTLHRIVAPFHGLPGKRAAVQTIFTAAELMRAKVVVLLDPAGPATQPDRVTEFIHPLWQGTVDFLAPRYRRHPRDGALVTQLVRPLVRAVYGVTLDEPLATEFGCVGRFVTDCLSRDMWLREATRFGIDMYLRTEAVAKGYRLAQLWRPMPAVAAPTAPRVPLRDTVEQVMLALLDALLVHAPFWARQRDLAVLPTLGHDDLPAPSPPVIDPRPLLEQAQTDAHELQPLYERVLGPALLEAVLGAIDSPHLGLSDELWTDIVYDFVAAAQRRAMSLGHLAQAFVPLYFGRAASFFTETAAVTEGDVNARLTELCACFEGRRARLLDTLPTAS